MLGAGCLLERVDYSEIPGLGHSYDSRQNQAMWDFVSRFSL